MIRCSIRRLTSSEFRCPRVKVGAVLAVGAALSFGLATLGSSSARADSPADAKDFFTLGRELRAQGDCASALPVFRSVYVIYPAGLGSLRNIAECEEALGHFASAHGNWLALLRALGTTHDARYAGWTDDAAQGVSRTAPKMATLIVDASSASLAARAAGHALVVTVNEQTLPANLWSTPLARDPGRYVVRIVGTGAGPSTPVVVDLGSGESRRVALRAPARSSTNVPATEAPPTTDDSRAPSAATTRRQAAWVTIGIGVAGLLGSGIALVVRQNALDELASQCPNYQAATCPSNVRSTVDRGQTASTVAEVLGAVGAAGITTGIVLWATALRHREGGPSASVGLVPRGLLVSGSF